MTDVLKSVGRSFSRLKVRLNLGHLRLSARFLLVVWVGLGCAGRGPTVRPRPLKIVPPPPAGMLRFEGISDSRCAGEWEAFQQAWLRAMQQVGHYVSTRLSSQVLDWAQQATHQSHGQRIVDVDTLFNSWAAAGTKVKLSGVYQLEQFRQQNADDSWKARVILLAPVEQLLADARQTEQELQLRLNSAKLEAEQTQRSLKLNLHRRLDQFQAAETSVQHKIEALQDAVNWHRRLEQNQRWLSAAETALTELNLTTALQHYRQIEILQPPPGNDQSDPPPTVQRLAGAIQQLSRAKLQADTERLSIPYRLDSPRQLSVQLTLGPDRWPVPIRFSFKEKDIVAEITTDRPDGISSEGKLRLTAVRQAPAGTTRLHLIASPAPQAWRQINDRLRQRLIPLLDQRLEIPVDLLPTRQSLSLALSFTSRQLEPGQVSGFETQLSELLRGQGYTMAQQANTNGIEVKGDLEIKSAAVGPMRSLSISVKLSFWRDNHLLAEAVRLTSAPQVDRHQEQAFAQAKQVLLQRCLQAVEQQITAYLNPKESRFYSGHNRYE